MTLVCRAVYAFALSLSAVACSGEPPTDAASAEFALTCAGPSQAPAVRARDRLECVAVGAAEGPPAEWPDVAGAPTVVYVRPGASAGDGTRGAPFADLAAALAAAPPGAVVALSRGVHTLAATVHIDRAVTLYGAGPGETTVDGPPGAPAVEVAAPEGGAVAATLAGVRVRARASGDAAADRASAGVLASGRGAAVTLRDVAVERFGDGVRADGATVCGRGVTVRGALRAGLAFVGGAVASVHSFAVRDGANVGVVVDASAVALSAGLVADNARDGVVLRGARDGGPCGEEGACAALAACGEPVEQRCVAGLALPPTADAPAAPAARACRGVSLLQEVALVGNHVTGLRAERLPPPEGLTGRARDLALAAPGAQATGVRLVVGRTRPAGALPGGDGVYVGPGARLSLDPEVASEENDDPGSLVTGNARTGLLVDGDRASPGESDALRTYGTLRAAGAMVRRNEGPGVYVQEGALVEALGYGDLTGNVALGLGVTSGGRVPLIQCEHFVGTRTGTVVTASGGEFTLGDGLSMAEGGAGVAGDTRIVESRFVGNARFGFILSGFRATLSGLNRVGGNRLGYGVFGGALEGAVAGLGAAYTGAPPEVARGALVTPTR